MAKSMRCKKEKRLRAIRREMVEPLYEKKDLAKFAAQEAALAAPKLPVRLPKSNLMEITATTTSTDIVTTTTTTTTNMDVEMSEDNVMNKLLKASGGVGKKSKRQFKVGKRKQRGKGKGKVRMKRHI